MADQAASAGATAHPVAVVAGDGASQQQPGGGSTSGSSRKPRSRRTRPSPDQRQQQLVPPPPGPNAPPPPGLTWQQQALLSPAAPPFQPSSRLLGDPTQGGLGLPQRERRPRSGGRGRGRGQGLAGDGTAAVPGMHQAQFAGRGPAAGQRQAASAPPELEQAQQARPVPQPRRRERPPRPQQQQQQQQRGAGSLLRPLEAAASGAANDRQRRQQAAPVAGGEPSSSSDAEGAGTQLGGQAQPQQQAAAAGGLEAAANTAAQPRQEPRSRQRQERQAGERGADAAGDAAALDSSGAAGPQPPEPLPDAPHCLVCCHEMAEVGIGACNHKQVCGTCTLRLRLCYDRQDCPLCKAELKEVIIAPWRPQLPDWQAFEQHPEWLARSAKWAHGSIWADRWRRGGRLSSRLLHDLQRRTALACAVCDPGGEAPLARREHLLVHVQEAHGLRLCSLCLQEGRLFPLELQAFPSLQALQAHSEAAHPHCGFCRRTFYDDDALWKHMHQAHFSCHVCPPPVAAHAYFNRAPDLLRHMRSEHFMCDEPECADCFVAFATADELRRHQLERHSARMPRWDSSRARPLQLDISFARRQGPLSAAEATAERRRQRQRSRGPQDVRMMEGARPGEGPPPDQWPAGFEYAREADGGLRVIDDADVPAAAYPGGGGGGGSGSGGGLMGAGSWAEHRPQRQQRGGGDFPSLSAAAAGEGGGGGGAGSSRPPPLVKKTVKCPCGRRVSHYAVAEGQEVPPLECDAVCRIEGRRQQLADAFGMDDPAHHAGAFERQRSVTYSGLLLAAAQQNPRFVEGVERQLAEFVADKEAKRVSLSAMPREQRAVVHALAEQYGLATTGYGQEPARYVELFKTPAAGIPARLLSRVAPTVPASEVAQLLRESEGHPMRLMDIAMSVDLRFYLRQWEGAYRLEWQGGDAAIVRFEREQDLKEALDVLGGGIRGLFRIDRSWRPKTAVATAPPVPSSSASSRGWAGAEAGGNAPEGSTWTAVAVAPRPAHNRPDAQQAAAAASGTEQQQEHRWAVMTGRRAARPAAAAAAAAGAGRNVLVEMVQEHEDAWTSDGSSEESDG